MSRVWERLAQEDGIVEWATVVAFGIAAYLLLSRLPQAWRDRNRLLTVALGCIGLFCVFVAGEEISWGQRLFAFQPPELFLERNFQQELNLHNVLMDERTVGMRIDSRQLVPLIALLYGVAGPLLARVARLAPAASAFPPLRYWPGFVAVAVLEIWYPVDLTGEGAELLLGLCFVAAAAQARPLKTRVQLVVVALCAGALVAPLFQRVVFGSDDEGRRVAATELELLAADLVRAGTKGLNEKKRVHKRVFTAVREEYFSVDGGGFLEGQASPATATPATGVTIRRDRRGYFLDPWQNAYWVLFEREDERLVLYSFGPNRQRDTAVRRSKTAEGDDVLVVVVLEPRAAP